MFNGKTNNWMETNEKKYYFLDSAAAAVAAIDSKDVND